MNNINPILPESSRIFNSKSPTEKANYLLTFPIYYVFELSEIDRLKDFLNHPPHSCSDDFRVAELFANQCFRKLQKLSFVKWAQLQNLPEIDVLPQEKIVSDE